MTKLNQEPLLTIKDLMEWWGVSEPWVRSQIFQGNLPVLRIGGQIRFHKHLLERYLREKNPNLSGGDHE